MLMHSDTSTTAEPGGRRRRWSRVTGAGLGLLAGAAFVLTPACGGGGGIGENGVHVVAFSHVTPACGGGGSTGDN